MRNGPTGISPEIPLLAKQKITFLLIQNSVVPVCLGISLSSRRLSCAEDIVAALNDRNVINFECDETSCHEVFLISHPI